jgi:hypothetical protein
MLTIYVSDDLHLLCSFTNIIVVSLPVLHGMLISPLFMIISSSHEDEAIHLDELSPIWNVEPANSHCINVPYIP